MTRRLGIERQQMPQISVRYEHGPTQRRHFVGTSLMKPQTTRLTAEAMEQQLLTAITKGQSEKSFANLRGQETFKFI